MRTLIFILFLGFNTILMDAQPPVYKDSKQPIEKRINDLVSKMTLEEKIMQLTQFTIGRDINPNNVASKIMNSPPEIGSLLFQLSTPEISNEIQKKAMEQSRLGIPILFGADVIHGLKTLYPIPLAQACSWNPEMAKKASEMAAREARLTGIAWTFSPMIDVAYDARWGRVAEGYGEDPYTNSVFCVNTVKGYQGDNMNHPHRVASCLKHFVGYSRSEGGRDYNYTDVPDQALWETYLPPFDAGIQAGAQTVMASFNDINGIPATSNYHLLTEILKNKWKHDGFVVSDWEGVIQLINQGVAADEKEAAKMALNAGVEMNMIDGTYRANLAELVKENKVALSRVDDAVKRILRVKFRLGLFDNPYVKLIPEKDRVLLPQDKLLAEKFAEESMVLLKNKDNILPLASDTKRIAVIGPLAKDSFNIMGTWISQAKPKDVLTFYDGIQNEFKAGEILYAKGCDFDGNNEANFENALKAAANSDVVLLFLGEKSRWSGENGNMSSIALMPIQQKLLAEIKKTGKPVILILSAGRPLELKDTEPLADAIIMAWQPGTFGGNALAGILSGRVNPSAKLAITFPLTTGQIPIHYNRRPSARPIYGKYWDIPTEPLYKFGYGLSYTTFDYDSVKLSTHRLKRGEKLKATLAVQNTGKRDGLETVHWYIHDPVASISRPVMELKYFDKKKISKGQTEKYEFEVIPERDLSFPDSKGNRILENGDYYLIVGNQKIKFELTN